MRLATFDTRRRRVPFSEKPAGAGAGGAGGGGGGARGGGGSSPPKSGGGGTPPKSGGGTTPPKSGGGSTPPKSGGGSNPPPKSGGGAPGGRTPTTVSTPNLPPGRGASSYGSGGGNPVTIPSGSIFAGRTSGGGSRSQVFGSRTYGSGYPGQGSRSVSGRSFPFGYWPLVWGASVGGGAAYLHNNEYGNPDNSSRPGGPLYQAPLMELNDNTTYHLVADDSSISAILNALRTNCTLSSSPSPITFNPQNTSQPQPEQVIQYYRSSSIALTLDGYNNSATSSNDSNAVDTPLPSGLNSTFLDCINQTIAASAPIEDVSSSGSSNSSPLTGGTVTCQPTTHAPFISSAWLIMVLLHLVF